MSSRQEEKERRRRERLAAEQAAQRSAAARKRVGIVAGAVLAVAVIVVVALALTAGGDDETEPADVAVPKQQITNLAEAADAAGCKVTTPPSEGDGHTAERVRYRSNPPTSGSHDPTASEEGIYAADNPPDVEQSVHALEHGRVIFQYKPGTPQRRIDQLEAVFNESVKGTPGYKTLVTQNTTGMKAAVAATAWTRSLTCPTWNDRVFDALRTFRRQYVDKGPEFLP